MIPLTEIKNLGIKIPENRIIQDLLSTKETQLYLDEVLINIERSRNFHKEQIEQALQFKQNSGMNFSDFTDQFEEHVSNFNECEDALKFFNHLKNIFSGKNTSMSHEDDAQAKNASEGKNPVRNILNPDLMDFDKKYGHVFHRPDGKPLGIPGDPSLLWAAMDHLEMKFEAHKMALKIREMNLKTD